MSDGSTDHPQLVSRRNLLSILGGLGLTSSVFARALLAQADAKGTVTAEMVRQAEWIADLELTDEQRQKLSSDLEKNARDAERIRAIACDADIPPASVFRPDWFAEPDAKVRLTTQRTPHSAPSPVSQPTRPGAMAAFPDNELGIAFASLIDQAAWLKAGKLSSVDLTKLYLDRLTKFDAELHCVVTLLSETALQQAQAADARRAAGKSIGILDGIPWVAKDLMAVPPFKTTWGAEAYKDQVRLTMSTVAERLQAAGGVLLAKVSLGALALGDIWFGGTTRNPWQTEQGSSGSSAGTCSAVVAGLASYGIGSETLGSIVSPCTRCCVSGLRPSYGRVSRFGCMPLAWSFDKLGPIARHIDDLGIVFSHILGPDGYDPTVVDRDFDWPNEKPLDQLVVGITEEPLSPIEQQALDWLKSKGARQVAVKLPDRFPLGSMTFMLNVEAATVFDDILR
ncbi:MAG: amidase, partial [Pirellulaceae bacterium]|nr:amidase [Pirellulaceae bacterium]